MPESPTNIILLSADALRADHLSCYGYDRETSPNLDKLYSESLAFLNAFSGSSHTREAIPSLLTGDYPDTAVNDSYQLITPTIASHFSQAGYKTGGFHSNPYASRAFGFNDGFDEFYDDLYLGQNRFLALAQRALDLLLDHHYARADKINELSLSWVDSLDSNEPFFLWNHYMDTHGPYEPPTEFDVFSNESSEVKTIPKNLYKTAVNNPEKIDADERSHLLNSYDGEIRYLDYHIGEFLDALKERNLLEESLVIFTSDHGDAFGEQGYYGHPRLLDDELLHVPLIIRRPDRNRTVYSDNVSTLDIVPTIAAAAGSNDINSPRENLLTFAQNGQNSSSKPVFSMARGEESESEIWRVTIRMNDLTAFADYNTEKDILDIRGDSSCEEELRAFVSERLSQVEQENPDKENPDNSAVENRLSALGYK